MPYIIALRINLVKLLRLVFSRLFLILIWCYQKFISPFTSGSCRYFPTCSEYGKIAILKHGAFKGGILTFLRILRCNPFCGCGCDYVPEEFELSKLFSIRKKHKKFLHSIKPEDSK